MSNVIILQRDSITLENNKPSANIVIQPQTNNEINAKVNYSETITLENLKPNIVSILEHKNETIEVVLEKNSGLDGREIELRKTSTHIQWHYKNSDEWFNLIALSELIVISDGWDFYATNWTETPTLLTSTHDGLIFRYVLKSVTRYRLVPIPYNSAFDGFYAQWDGTTLTELIVSRG